MWLWMTAVAWAAKPVTLTFAWPTDGAAVVTTEVVDDTGLPGHTRHVVYRYVHDARVSGDPTGWRLDLTLREGRVVQVGEADRLVVEALLAVASGSFAYVIDAHGALTALEGWDAASERAVVAFDALLATLPAAHQQAAGGAKDALTPQALEADARSKWWWGQLAGQRFKPGKAVVEDARTPVGPTAVPSRASTVLTTGVPCVDGGAPVCVAIAMEVTPDPAALGEAFRAMLPFPVSASVTSTTTVVVDPATLRPYRVTSDSGTELVLADGRPMRSQHKRVETVWAWAP